MPKEKGADAAAAEGGLEGALKAKGEGLGASVGLLACGAPTNVIEPRAIPVGLGGSTVDEGVPKLKDGLGASTAAGGALLEEGVPNEKLDAGFGALVGVDIDAGAPKEKLGAGLGASVVAPGVVESGVPNEKGEGAAEAATAFGSSFFCSTTGLGAPNEKSEEVAAGAGAGGSTFFSTTAAGVDEAKKLGIEEGLGASSLGASNLGAVDSSLAGSATAAAGLAKKLGMVAAGCDIEKPSAQKSP